jgi:hypothetical protein
MKESIRIAVWRVERGSDLFEDEMNGTKVSWVPLLYGYLVALIAVVIFIIGTFNGVDAAFDLVNPLHSREGAYGPFGGSLTSFESYRATQHERPTRMRPVPAGAQPVADTLTTAELRAQFDAVRADRFAMVRTSALRRLVKHGLLIVLAIILFVTHWGWIRRQREVTAA